ncbi:hypothetical protein [Pseudoxanthomonas sp. UTMC 1351]|uniref:hypothetical protein n=1 Tax=Pseudoxanthomonas sp. UTMC 1351 TaxID=2695853 RepID=UPI0034CD45DA
MPGIGEAIEGAVQQAPQPLRHGKASDFIRHYKPGWANSAATVKVGGTGEARMESAKHKSRSLRCTRRRRAFSQVSGVVRPEIGKLLTVPFVVRDDPMTKAWLTAFAIRWPFAAMAIA